MMVSLKTFAVFFALNCVSWTTTRADGAEPLDLAGLGKLATSLRAGDYALVRPLPSDATAEQQRLLCPSAIPSLVTTVCDSDAGLERRGKAAEVLALCTTNNPENRNAIATTELNNEKQTVHTGLVDVIQAGRKTLESNRPENPDDDDDEETEEAEDDEETEEAKIEETEEAKIEETEEAKIAATAIGNAAEAIYVLSFSNEINHAGFLKAGAIPALADMLLDVNCEDRHVCSRAIMWSAAALQNLAASYCSTDSGHCWWDWNDPDDKEKEKVLRVSSKSSVVLDSQKVREEIVNYGEYALVDALVDYACNGPVFWPHHSHEKELGWNYAWPSRGQVTSHIKGHEDAPSIIPWAAVGLIKSLALGGPEVRRTLLDDEELEHCLCHLSESPDWLEAAMAEDALYYLGAEECPPPYDEGCQNYSGWAFWETGDNCEVRYFGIFLFVSRGCHL